MTPHEQRLITDWGLQASEVLEVVDVMISEAEGAGRPSLTRRLWQLREAVASIDDNIALLTGELPE